MNGMPEELTALLEVACEAVQSGADVQQAVAVRTEKGNVYTLVRRDVSEKGRAEESRFVHRLAEAGEGRITALVCLWRDGALDVPSRHMAASLLAIDAGNREAKVLLRGAEDSHVRLLGTLTPQSAHCASEGS